MPAVTLTPAGPFSLASGIRFLEGFGPASYDHAADGILRLAFPADDGASVVAAAVRQEVRADGGTGTVRAEFTVHPGTPHPATAVTAEAAANQAVRAQLARILSLDVDATGFPGLAADPVVAGLTADHPGLRPVCFHSPYEAATWAIIGNRIRMTQAAAIKARIAHQHGHRVHIAGQTLHAFPTPAALRTITHVPGLTGIKIQRLHALAEAALDGKLDAPHLRALPADHALAELRTLPGIGPFSAELILIRGAGHPDVFPRHEPRVHKAVATAYGLGAPTTDDDVTQLAKIADRWKPYRSWVAFLLRVRAHDTSLPGPVRHGSPPSS
ncbi:DNA-3-methyladenine glycosylase family protein [Streptomyces nigrescens]|uniref:DNA-3-methyladenine glycosylase n=1 Tax=Streptomyces nigrescens TaxID=1920 RepID=A0A640TG35_STRNI|nr:DNA-3-methyladenine glycosylase [Streptomyces libani]WAT95406.1 DNA-3-methyladenine glycosylase [Streptomyces libani subsp. libani]GFE20625.1 DNA-3-methyladenine glycosylase II [Streptomyces libani subsp. libani]GGV87640.1 DNA-3-methyladenine glycosylase II [Streptomyces libani subsp. libani]